MQVTSRSSGAVVSIYPENWSKIDPERKRQWVAALRSGEYIQTSCALDVIRTTEDKAVRCNCCLGVYVRLNGAEEVGWYNDEMVYNFTPKEAPKLHEPMMLAALTPDSYYGLNSSAINNLYRLNDGGFTFAEIADIIEEHL